MSKIQTFTGKLVDPLNLQPEDINWEDIAHSLANQCRFTGHVRTFYSTAEHCVHVAEICPDPSLKLAALMHDGAEAYMSDIARPVKHHPSMAYYRSVEKHNQGVVFGSLGLPIEEHPTIKQCDRFMLGIEARDLMNTPAHGWWDEWITQAVKDHPLSVRRPWSPRRAERKFRQAFERYRRTK